METTLIKAICDSTHTGIPAFDWSHARVKEDFSGPRLGFSLWRAQRCVLFPEIWQGSRGYPFHAEFRCHICRPLWWRVIPETGNMTGEQRMKRISWIPLTFRLH